MKPFAVISIIALTACAPQPGPVKRQMVGLLEKFDRWDYNGDGYLEAGELKEAEGLSGIPTKDLIDFYDTNKDRKISLREAQAGMSRMDEARETVADIQDRP
jgi:Ca2+-binding EF-hand superfamily protein